jgi:hypothetical protein
MSRSAFPRTQSLEYEWDAVRHAGVEVKMQVHVIVLLLITAAGSQEAYIESYGFRLARYRKYSGLGTRYHPWFLWRKPHAIVGVERSHRDHLQP